MLSINTYTQEYIDGCRLRIDVQLSTYKALAAAANVLTGPDKPRLDAAIEAFEPHFFNNLFVQRSRTMEKKDGSPLNEVRVLCNSLLHNNAVLLADRRYVFGECDGWTRRGCTRPSGGLSTQVPPTFG